MFYKIKPWDRAVNSCKENKKDKHYNRSAPENCLHICLTLIRVDMTYVRTNPSKHRPKSRMHHYLMAI